MLGLFVRRCLVEYHRTSFPDRTKLFTIFRLYATGYTIDRDNISYDETGEYCRSVLVDDPLMPGQVYEYEGTEYFASLMYISFFGDNLSFLFFRMDNR